MSEVSLFIEDTAIKLLVTRGHKVDKWAKIPLEPGLVSEGLIVEEEQIADRIKELFKQQKIGTKTVIAGLSGLNSVYRLTSLPEMPENILSTAIRQEAARILPVPMDQVYLSYQAIPSEPEETRVFLSAFPKSNTDALLSTLRKAGIRASTLDLSPLALCRTVDAPEAVIIDAHAASLDIAILVDRVPQVIRSFSLPGDTESLAERLPTIVEELDRTTAFYNSGHKEKPLLPKTPVFVAGDLVMAPESWPLFSGNEESLVTELPSPVQAPEGFDASQFMTNIGLCLKNQPLEKEGNYSIINFNALPAEEKPKEGKVSAWKVLTPIGIVVGVGLLVWLWFQADEVRTENEALRDQVEIQQAAIPPEREEISALQEDIAAIGPQVEPLQARADILAHTYTDMSEERSQMNSDLRGIVNFMPEEAVNLRGIDHEGPWVTVNGTALEESYIFDYARNLRGSGRYSSVIITSISASYKEMIESGEVVEDLFYNFSFLLVSTNAE
jgi:type IV pilus assembly protein PilM